MGYLFLQKICSVLNIDALCTKIKNRHQFRYALSDILSDLIYARILSPSSKLGSYAYCQKLLEAPGYSLQDMYRSLSVIAEESDFIQKNLYRESNFIHGRNTTVLYYDCTNYYFEIEEEDGCKRYGKSKEHRPNPIITMGLFMDADGIPLSFDIFPGNLNEQKTLKPLENKILHDFGCTRFIYCSDAGLGSRENKLFNSIGGRAYVITQSLKKLRREDRETALDPRYFRRPGSNRFVDLRTLDETNPEVFHTTYYREIPLINGNTEETLIVTYSPKYKAYQRKIREKQLQRAQKLVNDPGKNRKTKNPNDPTRFIKKTAISPEGEIVDQYVYDLDFARIEQEQQYDGFYAVVTNLEDDPVEILKINQRRWEIEENFRIMKTEFEARPVYVRREDRIKAHFLICYISLLIYRLLEKKLGEKYTCSEVMETLRNMNLTMLPKGEGYIPAYKRTGITDALHDSFGFHTDYEFITKKNLSIIIKESKRKKFKVEKK